MKALTLRHPWAWAVAYAGKRLENRTWDDRLAALMGLPELTGELIAIHGGTPPQRPRRTVPLHKLAPSNPWRQHCEDLHHIRADILNGELPDGAAQFLAGRPMTPESFILPGIVAVATLSGHTRGSRDVWAAEGCLHLLLSDVITLPEPVACPGAQGFWNVPPAVEQAVRRQIGPERAVPEQWGELTAGEWLA